MKKLKRKIKLFNKTAVGCLGFIVVVLVLCFGINIAKAAWEEPAAQAPDGNIYVPLNVGPENQAKKGKLLLDPLYNPYGSAPGIDYPLEVRGPQDVYINYLEIDSDLTVDTDTLYVDGTNDQVGISTLEPEPGTKLEVVGGGVSVGSAASPVTGIGITASTNGTEDTYGIYGLSLGVDQPSIYGQGIGDNSIGVYGLNTSSGYGIYAETSGASAVVGTTSAPYSSSPPYVAGVFARARGLGAWAGYFEQRLYGSDDVVGRKFVPNRLQYSQIPYTAGWKMREIGSSERAAPAEIVFDGNYIWAMQMDDYHTSLAWLLDPVTGDLIEEFEIEDSDGFVGQKPQEAIFAGGYIWTVNRLDDNRGLTRINPTTHEAVHYETGTHSGGSHGPIDLVYDDQSAGGPYIWVVNRHDDDSTYSVTRLLASDPTTVYAEYDMPTDQQCSTYKIVEGVGVEELTNLTYPTGITIQPNASDPTEPTLWISFGGHTMDKGEGIAKFSVSGPVATFSRYCSNESRGPDDIAYGGGYIWVANNPHYDKKPHNPHDGFTQFDASTGAFVQHTYIINGAAHIEFDNESTGGPYVWLSNLSGLYKYDINCVEINLYPLPNGNGGFDFDRTSGSDDYVWSGHSSAGSVSRNMIDDPYTTDIYQIKGAFSKNIVFDGTYIWSSNYYSNSVIKYRASDGAKVGMYEAGWAPGPLAFDGTYIWVRHHTRTDINDLTELAQIRASDGVMMDNYNVTTRYNAFDMIFDGTYLWVSDGVNDNIRRIETATCDPGDEDSCTLIEYSVANSPDQMIFDGEYIWVTYMEPCGGSCNCFSKIDPSTTTGNDPVVATYSISEAKQANGNLKAIEFDGTYLWIGTQHVDDDGNSVYKIDPVDGTVVGKYRIYTEPGLCESGDREHLYCTCNNDCTDGGTCSAHSAEIRGIGFDGTEIWVLQGRVTSSSPRRECYDYYDNDGDNFCDYDGCCNDWSSKNQTDCGNDGFTWLFRDEQCTYDGITSEHPTMGAYDLHEDGTGVECSDKIDNDGNGLCDYDGAAGYPGCSGKPDPGCASIEDQSEVANTYNMAHLTRIMAATGEVVESIPYNNYCSGIADIVFDGTSVWFNEEARCGDGYSLSEYYAGSGLGNTDFGNTVSLQSSLSGTGQPGSFSMAGSANFGAKLTVIGDLVVQSNTWGGTVDNERDFGVGCDDGEFAKGVDITVGKLQCRPL